MTAREYERLKVRASKAHPRDQVAYAKAKAAFVRKITSKAKSVL